MNLLRAATRVTYICVHTLPESTLQPTKIFKNGNSQAVRIPAELAYDRTDVELEIERIGDEIRIRPVRRPLSGVLKKFARFGPAFMAEGRGEQEQAEREVL